MIKTDTKEKGATSMKRIEYEPCSVKDLLKEMKDTSELMIDLAYSSLLFYNEDIANEVLHLGEKMNFLIYHVRISAILGARRIDEAEEMSGILQVANSSEAISNAAEDISKLTLAGMKIPEMIKPLLKIEETVMRANIVETSSLTDKTLGELRLETETGMRAIAIRREGDWIFDPNKNTRLLANDVIIAEGPEEGVPILYELSTHVTYREREKEDITVDDDLANAAEIIGEMKNLSELAVSLAYGSLLFDNEDIAREVGDIESKINEMCYELERLVLKTAKKTEDYDGLRCLIELARSSENISDAAYEMADVLFRDIDTHPAFIMAVRESEEIITTIAVEEGSYMDRKTLGELNLETDVGMDVLAIRRMERWIYRPPDSVKIMRGDTIIAKGTRGGEEELRKMSSSVNP